MPEERSRLVLVHSPLRNVLGAATPDYIDENRGATPPMGLLYLQAAVEQSRHTSVFLDAELEGWTHAVAAEEILRHEPDLIGLSAMTFTIRDAILLAREIRSRNREVKILVGGPHPTVLPKETAAMEEFDFAMAGEGERSLVQLLDCLRQPEAWPEVPGLAYKGADGVVFNDTNKYIEDLDQLPFPARSSSPYQRYSSVLAARNPITIMITSRGCPFNCIFCNRMGRRYRYHSADYVLREFDEIQRLGIQEVFIHDDTFTLNQERVRDICNGLIQRNYGLIWEGRTRVDCVNKELLTLMKASGCHRLSFGVESGSEEVLRLMRKGIDLQRVRDVFRWCRELGIVTLADFMVGNVGETREDVAKSVALMKEISPDYVQWSILSAYPGTPVYQLGRENGMYPRDVWGEFAADPMAEFKCPVWTEHFTEDELSRLSAANYRTFYFQPRFIWRQLKKITSRKQFLTLAKSAWGMLRR